MPELIGRLEPKKRLLSHLNSAKSEFVAVYGRRRVGKTFLIRKTFDNQFHFQHTALANVNMRTQLTQFHVSLSQKSIDLGWEPQVAKNWIEAFRNLSQYIERISHKKKKIIFIDELPWMDTQKSDFLSGLEHFWNSWASVRNDILLIVCGSAASWMINELINNKGGLHNRVTDRIKLNPFTLSETEQLLNENQVTLDRYQILVLYMAFGGIPYYLEKIKPGKSAMQNINELCFDEYASFRGEYNLVFASLFNHHERHLQIIEALSGKEQGLSRKEIVLKTKLSDGGGLTRILNELEESGFIRKYKLFGKRKFIYQLIDFYSLFYLRFIKNADPTNKQYWMSLVDSSQYYSWAGLAFEKVCLQHAEQLKRSLGISGIQTSLSTWRSKNAQIDLLIDRKDQVINVCEMKFSIHSFTIDEKYADSLKNKLATFKKETKTRKSLFLTMVTTFGLASEKYAGLVQNRIEMDALFID